MTVSYTHLEVYKRQAIPYMYGNGEAGLTLRDVFVKGTVLEIHCLLYTSLKKSVPY